MVAVFSLISGIFVDVMVADFPDIRYFLDVMISNFSDIWNLNDAMVADFPYI